jgi:hypothetical protein
MSALFKPEMLKRMFKKCKLQPVAFAFVEGEEGMLLVMSDAQAGKALFEKAKKEAGARKGTFGTARLNGDTLELAVDKNFSGLKAKFTELAKEEGFKIKKCRIVDSTGKVSEDGEAASTPAGGTPGTSGAGQPESEEAESEASEQEDAGAEANTGEEEAESEGEEAETPAPGETTPEEEESGEAEEDEGERIPFERLQRVTGKAADAWDKAWKIVSKQALDQQKAIFAEGDPANNPIVRAMAKWHKAIPDFGGAVHGLRDAAKLAQPDAWRQAAAHYRTMSKAFRAHLGAVPPEALPGGGRARQGSRLIRVPAPGALAAPERTFRGA